MSSACCSCGNLRFADRQSDGSSISMSPVASAASVSIMLGSPLPLPLEAARCLPLPLDPTHSVTYRCSRPLVDFTFARKTRFVVKSGRATQPSLGRCGSARRNDLFALLYHPWVVI